MSREKIGSFEVQHLHGPWEIGSGDDELVVLCLVRDGVPWVHTFIEHYFSLGAGHLIFLDNGSNDGTVAAACKHENVTVLRTKLSFGAGVEGTEGQNLMRRYLIQRFGRNRWSLCVDIDELFDFPFSDVIGLNSFLRYLNSKSYTAVTAQMLDMFPEKLAVDSTQETVEELKEEFRFYDISKIERSKIGKEEYATANNGIDSDEVAVKIRGGIRQDAFGFKPLLTKYPLLFSDGKVEHSGVHAIRNARISDVACVLLHYKFYAFTLQDYWYKAIEYKKGRGPFMRSRYEQYMEVLKGKPEMHLKLESSKELLSVNDLLENGFLVASEDYLSWIDAEEERRFAGVDSLGGPDATVQALLRSKRGEREKILRIGRLEQRVLAHQQQHGATARRIRTLKGKLGVQTEEARELGQQVLNLERKTKKQVVELRDRGRRLRRSKQRAQRLTRQNHRLKQQIRNLRASRAWRFLSIIHSGKERFKELSPFGGR